MSSFSIRPDSHLGPVHLTVSDLGRSLDFYEKVLGFGVLEREGETAALTADKENPLVFLTEIPGAPRRPSDTSGLYHFAVLLPSRVDLARSLRRLGETSYPLGGCSDHSVSEALYLDDPDGNGIELYRDRPRSEWPWREGQKGRMTTDPLDLHNLLDEAEKDSRPWDGLPEGTRIGHVHLHVADLDRAEAFYRDVLGFEVMSHQDLRGASFLATGGYHHHIGLNVWAGVGVKPPPGNAAGLRYFTFCLPEEAELRRLANHLESIGVPLTRKGEGLFLRDPSENAVFLLAGCNTDEFQSLAGLKTRSKSS
ncbi:MAG: VOC family protein [Nitrospinota bacterium]